MFNSSDAKSRYRQVEMETKKKTKGRLGVPALSVLLMLLVAIACRKKATDTDAKTGTFVIHNLGVVFGPWNPATNRAGDFLFRANEQKVFLEFGARVADASGGTKELPTFEYRVAKNALVTAIAEGRVIRFGYQNDTQDYEFSTQSSEDPDWEVGYDHIANPRVAEGDMLSPGTVLGNPGTWNADLGRFEIMINNNATGLSYCPFCVFDPDSAAAYKAKVLRHMADWETFKRDTAIYDEKRHPFPGCRYEDMKSY
ncbi:MAG TPA: hypothetical protein VGB38_07065 [bacterium]